MNAEDDNDNLKSNFSLRVACSDYSIVKISSKNYSSYEITLNLSYNTKKTYKILLLRTNFEGSAKPYDTILPKAGILTHKLLHYLDHVGEGAS